MTKDNKTRPKFGSISIVLPTEFFYVSKSGHISIQKPLTEKGNIKTKDKQKAVKLETKDIDKPVIVSGQYIDYEEAKDQGKTTREIRKLTGEDKDDLYKKKYGTFKKMTESYVEEDRKYAHKKDEGYKTPFLDKRKVINQLKSKVKEYDPSPKSDNWITFVKQVQKELGISYKDALKEASKRRKK